MTRERWLLAVILAVGCLLRLTYLLEVTRAPDFAAPQFEAQYHDYWARALVSGDWTPPAGVTDPEIRQRPYFRPPGYPFFLALVYRLTGPGYLWPRVVQMVIGLAGCLLLFTLTRRGFGTTAALFATALLAVYSVLIFFEAELMAVSLLVLLMLATLVAAIGWREGFTVPRALGTGVLIGLAALVRPNAVTLLPALLLWVGWLAWRRSAPFAPLGGDDRASATRGAFLKPALALTAATLLTTAPATLRNHSVAGDPVWITSNAGINLFVGTHPDSDGIRPGVAELGEIAGLESGWDSFDYPLVAAGVERTLGRELTDSEVSTYFTRRALDYAASQPLAVARLTLRKLALFWGPVEVSNNKVIELAREASPTLGFGPGFATVLALALAGVGLWAWEGRSGGGPDAARGPAFEVGVLLLLVVAAYSVSFLPFFVASRFRAPLVPLLVVFAGHALAGMWRALHDRRHRHLAISLAIIVGLRALTGSPWVPYEPDRALWHWRQGLLWKAQGQGPRALEEFQLAVAANPDHHEARLSLAEALVAGGRLEAAIAEYRATLALDPPAANAIAAHNNLARILAAGGDLGTAIEHWQAVLEIDPDRVSALTNLAYALATQPEPERRDPERAVVLAERACELTGGADPRPLSALAAAYRAVGREAEAEVAAQRAATLAAAVRGPEGAGFQSPGRAKRSPG